MNAEFIAELKRLIAKYEDVPEIATDVLDSENSHKESISMMVSGTPDLHIRNPEQYEKMAPYADPEREPFTADTWFRFVWLGKRLDPRPFKHVEIDGVKMRRVPSMAASHDYDYIVQGVVDVTERPMYAPANAVRAQPFSQEAYEYIYSYEGGLNESLRFWPRQYREAYEESH